MGWAAIRPITFPTQAPQSVMLPRFWCSHDARSNTSTGLARKGRRRSLGSHPQPGQDWRQKVRCSIPGQLRQTFDEAPPARQPGPTEADTRPKLSIELMSRESRLQAILETLSPEEAHLRDGKSVFHSDDLDRILKELESILASKKSG